MKAIRNIAGFTMIELISVLILVGIVSAVATARFSSNPFQTASFDEEIRAALRFAQKFAVMSGCDVQVNIAAASDSYDLSIRNDVGALPNSCLGASGAFTSTLPNPTGGVYNGSAPGSVDVSTDFTFFYDGQGRPSSGGVIIVDGASITVEPVTGYVY